ncbi:MAG: polysaccharide deacetylase family protein [Selenomonadaceae bacterium]|nr:polysaccharide deacetylase family protein [Selenomonadaceae bacterium]
MKKIFLIASLLMTMVLGSARSFAAVEETRSYFPPVLMYHDVKMFALNKFDVTIKDFVAQLKWLQKNNYQTLSMDEFVEILESGKKFPRNAILITFDDGYQEAGMLAARELRDRGMKATFFVNPNLIGNKKLETKGYPYLTAEEVKALAATGLFSIESHTMSHPHLDKLSAEDLKRELEQSKAAIEELTGHTVKALAYPFGDYDQKVIDATIAAGYSTAFAVQDRGLLDRAARWTIPRIYMGVELSDGNQKLFKKFIKSYKKMPPEMFAERWAPLNQ